MLRQLQEDIELLVRSRYPILYLRTYEEGRAERMLRRVAKRLSKQARFWSCSRGWHHTDLEGKDTHDPVEALQEILSSSERALFVLEDLHPFMNTERHPRVVRTLRDMVRQLKTSYKTVILLSPLLEVPEELDKDIHVVDVPLPSAEELGEVLDDLLDRVEGNRRLTIDRDPDLRERVIQAALGLTENEAGNVFAKAIVHQASFDEEDIDLVLSEKKQLIRRSGLLEYVDVEEELRDLGGLEGIKGWLRERRHAFSEKARTYGLPAPKGMLLLGVQGCGKSVCCKAVASLWRMPLLRMDVGALFNPYIGSSEANMRQAIRTAESLAPAVLWLDEIEKGFSGLRSSGSVDSGVTARVFASFLTWMQEKTAPVFITATANAIRDLPPELLRKGRFDEIFFVDLPNPIERREIFEIHLERRGRDPASFELDRLVDASEGYSGAEIEQCIVDAMFAAFPQEREMTSGDMEAALGAMVPLSRTMEEQITALRDWATRRARHASG